MKKILVTGGAGFVGSHLCKRLLEQDNHVLCIDNYFSGNKKNIESLLTNPYFEVIRQDICIPLYVEVDEIYNLACPASPINYQIDPIQTMKTSVIGTYNMLGLAKRTKAKLLFTSTSEVYGNPKVHPQIESYNGDVNIIGPRSCYDEGKRAAETLCMDYYKVHNVDVKIARLFNTYGPYMALNDGRVVSNFITQALSNDNITIYGTGIQTRSLCFIDDMIDALIKLMNTNQHCTGPYNIGNPQEIAIIELAATIKTLTNSKSKIVFKQLPVDDPIKRKPDITKITGIIDWIPTTSLLSGLEKTIDYFKKVL